MLRIMYILLILSSYCITSERPTIGAIRWDAWYGGNVTKVVEKTLGSIKYHDRLPWFANVSKNNKVTIDGSKKGIMDKEIMFAYESGIDYWAFLIYPESNSMSRAIKQYLKSKNRDKINFCVILRNTLNKNTSKKEWDRVLKLLQEPGYQKVLNGRPLVYIFNKNVSDEIIYNFRRDANKINLNPYIVSMSWNFVTGYKKQDKTKFDAFSSYGKASNKPKFIQLVKSVEKDWERALNAKVPFVPYVTTGWDKRPRQDYHVPWEKHMQYLRQRTFPNKATSKEIALHLSRAISFVKSNPQVSPANTIIIYAWNENDEGGWIVPTWQRNGNPNTSRIETLKKILN